MSVIPDLSWVDRVYALVRDELPGGRVVAPGVSLLVLLAVAVWAGGYVWRGLVTPLMEVTSGVGLTVPAAGQLIGVGVVVVAMIGLAAIFQVQVGRLRRGMGALLNMVESSFTIQDAIVNGLPKDLDALKKRIVDLESHTDIHSLRKFLTDRFIQRELAIRGLKEVGENLKSGDVD